MSSRSEAGGEADVEDRGRRDTPLFETSQDGGEGGRGPTVEKKDCVVNGGQQSIRPDDALAHGTEVSVPPVVRGEENVWGTYGKATDYFKEPEYRKYQKETLVAIESFFEGGAKTVILEAPTGFGKSAVANALAFQSNDAYILTVQKILQDQYETSYPNMYVMKGRGAYSCLEEKNTSCAKGPCRRGKVETHPDCPYKMAKEASIKARVTVHNFDSFYYQCAFGFPYAGRRLLICDEAHSLEGKYLGFMEFSITAPKIPRFKTIEGYDNFLSGEYTKAKGECNALETKKDVSGISEEELERLETLGKLTHKLEHYFQARKAGGAYNGYVFNQDRTSKGEDRVTFKPLFVGDYIQKNLFNYGGRVLLMSATILNKALYCKEVGLALETTKFIKVPSTFPACNRPILRWYAGAMNRTNIEATLPKMLKALKVVMERHPNRRGIVHTHTERIANYIKENLKDDRLTFNKDFPSAKEALSAHAAKEGSVLVASGLREGIDLSDDLSRFCVFCKVPYPDLGDARVARKAALDDSWYSYHAALMFVQMYGRSIRHETDKAITYILDADFNRFYQSARQFIPIHVREAVVWR
jgi:Rad3-related DNA helicase